MRHILRRAAGICLLLLLSSSAYSAEQTRLLLRPPDEMPSTRIEGRNYVNGEVYLVKTADPKMLRPLGYRDVQFIAGATHYNRYYAQWPRAIVLDSLPAEIVGINYDFIPPPPGSNVFVFSKNMGPKTSHSCYCSNTSSKAPDGFCYRKYVQAFPIEPDTMFDNQPYVQGTIYLSNDSELEKLKQLGFIAFRPTRQSRLNDPLIEDYISQPKRFAHQSMPTPCTAYKTYWPMNLDVQHLPRTVINLISDYETVTSGIKRLRSKTTILQF